MGISKCHCANLYTTVESYFSKICFFCVFVCETSFSPPLFSSLRYFHITRPDIQTSQDTIPPASAVRDSTLHSVPPHAELPMLSAEVLST